MDFQALPRRDLQALCKRNAIRANMSNAAMADALRSLQSVEGIDEIRPPAMSAVAGEEQRHGCPLPRGGRSPTGKGTAAAEKMEEAAPPPRDCSQKSRKNTAARDATVPVDAEAVSTGKRRTRRSRVSKSKKVSDQVEAAAEQNDSIDPILFEGKSVVGKEQNNGCPLPRGRTTRSGAAPHKAEDAVSAPDTLQSTQKTAAEEAVVPVEVEEISTGNRRTRKPRRSKVKVALCKNDGEEVVAAACTEPIVPAADTLQSTQKTAAEEAVPLEVEISTGKRRTRKSRRSKVKVGLCKKDGEEVVAAACTKPIAGPAVVLHKSRDDPNEEAVIDQGAAKPQEGEVHCQNPSVCSGKRRTRRSRRSKVKMTLDMKEEEATKELTADSFDAVMGSAVVSDIAYNDFKSVVEVGATNFQEGIVDELETTSTIQKYPSMAIMKNPEAIAESTRCVQSIAESRGQVLSSVRGGKSFSELPVYNMTYHQEREDGFIVTGAVDQSNLLVNTLDRLAKTPMYKFTVKEEEKHGECWWMLM